MTFIDEIDELETKIRWLHDTANAAAHAALDNGPEHFLDGLREAAFWDAGLVTHCERLVELQPLDGRARRMLGHAMKMAALTQDAIIECLRMDREPDDQQ